MTTILPPTASTATPIADICLYGGRSGAGYLVSVAGQPGVFGHADPVSFRSLTDALWLGVLELNQRGLVSGVVRVFEPTGERVALLDIARPVYFSELVWSDAPRYVISAAQLEAAATPDLRRVTR